MISDIHDTVILSEATVPRLRDGRVLEGPGGTLAVSASDTALIGCAR